MRRTGPGWGWDRIHRAHRSVRHRHASFPIATPFYDGEGDGGGGGGGDGKGGGEKDAAYWQGEAKKAFAVRDAAKEEVRKLKESGALLTDEDRQLFDKLKTDAAHAEEERAKKAGEWEKLQKTLIEKHTKEIEQRDGALKTVTDRFRNTVVRAEFGSATDLFGGHAESKTVLDATMAIDVLGRYVSVVDDEADPRGYRIVVKDPSGTEIRDGKGNPVPFAEAIAEVIAALPNKDRILRGGGKAGSGAAGHGPAGDGTRIDLSKPLTREQLRDPKVRTALKNQRTGGGMILGRGFEKLQADA